MGNNFIVIELVRLEPCVSKIRAWRRVLKQLDGKLGSLPLQHSRIYTKSLQPTNPRRYMHTEQT